jgi:simple sugar transport system ATP-binding protein
MVLITHKLHEARAIADRVSVLRGGRIVLEGADPTTLTDSELVHAMVGTTVPPLPAARPPTPTDAGTALELRGVSVKRALRDVHLTVARGELVGVAGVAGNGQRELYEVALGLLAPTAGEVVVAGHALGRGRVREAIEAGAVGVPEDPVADAVVRGLSVRDHMALTALSSYRRRLGVDWRAVGERLQLLNEQTRLRVAAPDREVATLSGGNIQRVMLVRSIGAAASLVVAAYPSRGLDVATTRRTQELLLERRAEGAGVLLISEDLDELMELSDRIAVLHAGAVAGIVRPGEADRYQIGRLMLEGTSA